MAMAAAALETWMQRMAKIGATAMEATDGQKTDGHGSNGWPK